MSKPIKISEEMLEALKVEFSDYITHRLFDGKVSFQKTIALPTKTAKAYVNFTATAFAKMTMLIQHYSTEVAWHGVVQRSEEAENVFNISDILVYPQRVTGATVNTDQAPYESWLFKFGDDVFNNIRMQGHSHVTMSTSPSPTDLEHQRGILKQVCDDDYYIFMIWNKRFERTIVIYDMKNNTLYENADVVVGIGEAGLDLEKFINDSKEMVKNYYSTAPTTNYSAPKTNTTPKAGNTPKQAESVGKTQNVTVYGNTGGQKPIAVHQSGEKPKEKPKPAIGRGWSGMNRNASQYDEEDDYYYGGYGRHYQ